MLADVIKRAQAEGVELYLENDQLKYRMRQGKLSPAMKQEIVAHKETIISLLRGQAIAVDPEIPVVPRETTLECSFAQQRLWFVDQLEGGSAQYNIPAALRLTGRLDEEALQRAIDAIVERHEVLRTVYRAENGAPVQIIQPVRTVTIARVDLTTDADREERVQELARAEAEAAFDLSADLMLRVGLLKLAEEEHVLLFTMHHIASDGWSMGVLVREFVALYSGQSLPALPIQYADYAQWQRNQGASLERQLGYWKTRLNGIPQLHSLPLDKPRPVRQSFVAQRHTQLLGRDIVHALQQLGREQDATLFMTLQSAFALLLSRWSGANDVVMAVPTAGRTSAGVEPLIGFFINTLVFRNDFERNDSFRDVLTRAKKDTLETYANQQVPFEMLVDELKPERALSYNPLAQVKFVLQNHREGGEGFALPGLTAQSLSNGVERIRFDLDLTASESRDGLVLNWSFKDELFELGTIERMADCFAVLLRGIVATPETPVKSLPLLDDAATQSMLALSRGAVTSEGRGTCVHHVIEAQAATTPDAVAVRSGHDTLTFEQLNAKANRLAHYLIEQGIEPAARVGLYVERSADVLVGMLAILKTGAAYVPFEPSNTAERLRHVIANGQIEVVLTQSQLMDKLPVAGIDVVLLDDAEWLDDYDSHNPGVAVSPSDSAYVIYTSGSTGVPKGVEILHSGLADYCAFASQRYYAAELAGSFVVTSHGFDITVPSLYLPLMRGGCVNLSAPGEELNELATMLAGDDSAYLLRMTPMHLTGALSLLPDATARDNRQVFVIGGEAFPATLARELQTRFPNAQIFNHYGPTETVVGCAMYDVTANLVNAGERLPIGRAMHNTELYVLNEDLQLAPVGVAGELHIGGAGVARGYVNQPELTAQKFVDVTFNGRGSRVYKSGDLVRYLPTGELDFLGRIDNQVKIRGFRIELGEIETAIKAEESVEDALVVASGEGENKTLAAYVVAQSEDVVAALRLRLKQALPEYMIPSAWCVLEAFPLNANGKIDRKALPAIDRNAASQYVAPSTETEQRLAEIWTGILKLATPVSVTANFFELGGHSLLATRVVSAVSQAFHKSLPVRTLFEHTTVQSLAAFLDAQTESGPVLIRKSRKSYPATAMQQGMYFHAQLDRGAYVTQLSPIFLGAIDAAEFKTSWQRVIDRHDILRTAFLEAEEGLQQVVVPQADVVFHSEDLSALSREQQAAHVDAYRPAQQSEGFDFSEAALHRVALFRLGATRTQLVWTYHNIILDAQSAVLVLREVFEVEDRQSCLSTADPEKQDRQDCLSSTNYLQWLASRDHDAAKQFWRRTLSDLSVPTRVILGRGDAADRAVRHFDLVLSSEETSALEAFARSNGTTLEAALQLAWAWLLHRYTRESDVVFGAVHSGRGIDLAGIENMVGSFVQTVPMRVSFGDTTNPAELLRTLGDASRSAQEHGTLSLADIQQQSGVGGGVPLFDSLLIFNETSFAAELAAASGMRLESFESDEPTQFPLTLTVTRDQTLTIRCGYSARDLSSSAVRRLLHHFGLVLAQLPAATEISRIDLLGDDDRARLAEWNGETAPFDADLGFHELFERHAALTPDHPAVEFNDRRLTYRELNEAANRVAHWLLAQGVTPETKVGLSVERSVEMVIGMFGILKAGAAYVPLDPNYPAVRLQHVIADTGMTVVLTQSHLLDRLPLEAMTALALDRAEEALQPFATTNPDLRRLGWTSSNLCYVIYTSGSTGIPKGVMVEHRHVQGHFAAVQPRYRHQPQQRVLSLCSFGFDVFVEELCLSLLAGGTLVMSPEGLAVNAQAFWTLVANMRVTAMSMPTSYFHYLCGELTAEEAAIAKSTLQLVIMGGEALLGEHAARWQRLIGPEVALWNGYGPTEATVFATVFDVTRYEVEEGKNPPIGRPLPNYECYVVDANGALCPVGVPGELYLGGSSVARGYLNREELTADRFVQHAFRDAPDARLYRTGDLVRYPENGEIEYLGRIDQQVKIRGFRVELGEIETQLLASGSLKEAIVIASGRSGEQQLIAYVVPEAKSDERALIDSLRALLKQNLPSFMTPGAFVVMETLPRNFNGKIDKRALPAPDRLAGQEHVAPSTPTEVQLAAIWENVLKLEGVSATANFFEIGGQSLLAMRVGTAVAAVFSKNLPVRALFEHNTIQSLARHIDTLDASEHTSIRKTIRQDALPLSFAQQRLWFIDQLEGGSAQYNMPAAFRLKGDLDVDALQRSLNEIVRRHEVLRTTYHVRDGHGVQVVDPYRPFPLGRYDLTSLQGEAQDAELDRIIRAEASKIFDLRRDLMLRVGLAKLSEREHVVLFAMHHVASDGWSLSVLAREFMTLYTAFVQKQPNPLRPLEIQYGDYAAWQRDFLNDDSFHKQLDYWKRQLADLPPVHSLPLDAPRTTTRSLAGDNLRQELPLELLLKLRELAQANNVTLFMLLQTAFALLLGRWSNDDDVVFGTPVAGRSHRDLEPLIGFFVNTLLMRTDLAGDVSFAELLKRGRAMALDAYSNQDVPFEAIVDELKPERSLSHTTMFQITFGFDNNEKSPMQLPGLELELLVKGNHVAKFDLNFAAAETKEGLALSWSFASSLFHRATIERMAASFEVLLNEICEKPAIDVHCLNIATTSDAATMAQWNAQQRPFPAQTIHQLFEAHAQRTPEQTAVVCGNESLTYAQLDVRANRVANWLVAQDVKPEDFVGICMERSLDMAVALIAILKAGGAYVPLDPNYPEARLDAIVADSRARVVLTRELLAEALHFANDIAPSIDVTPNALAYLIYTSGSTGTPKGVMVEHQSVVRLVIDNTYVALGPDSRILQASSPSFDAATFEIWGALLNGGTLVMYPEKYLDLSVLNRELESKQVNTIWLTSGLFEQWSQQLPRYDGLRTILAGGDVVNPRAVERVYRAMPRATVVNGYGPTENTTFTCCYPIPRDADFARSIPLGPAINGTTLYVLNDAMTPLPLGAVGELYAGGAGVTRGYLHQPELTAEKFVTLNGERLYKTGDLVRFLPDGVLEFIGRADDQVKIRGFRIELGEIAAQLVRLDGVDDAIVLARGEGTNKKLVAYVIARHDAESIRQQLRQVLPDYMVPAAIVVMESFPLNANGKVDKSALPEPELQQADSYVAPRNETEEKLAAIWSQLLKLERVGIDDNFFAIGGDSILSIQAVSRANQAGIGITTRQLFEHQTIAALAAQARHGVTLDTPQEPVTGALSLLPIQRDFLANWLDPQHFNQSVLLTTPADFDAAFLEEMVAALYRRHDALRLRFTGLTATHEPLSDETLAASCIVEPLPEEDRGAFITARCDHYQREFDLASGPLFRAVYFAGAGEGRLFLLAHHIVVDGVSWRILLADIEQAYRQYTSGGRVELAAKSSSFQQWGAALAEYAQSPALEQEKEYWLSQYELPAAPLPVDMEPSEAPTGESTRRERVRLTQSETQSLLQRCAPAYRTSINELLLSGVYLGFHRWTGANVLRLALEGHGRESLFERLDTTQTVGWFTTVYPLTLHSTGGDVAHVIKSTIKSVKEQYRAIPSNGIGFGVLSEIAEVAELKAQQHPQVVFNYLGQLDQAVEEDGAFRGAPEHTGASHSERQHRTYQLVLNGKVIGGELVFGIDYSNLQYRTETMAQLAACIEDGLRAVIEHCLSIERGDFTPSDFPLATVSQDTLDVWQRRYAIARLYPATAMQQGMYFHAQLDKSAYVTQMFPILRGNLSPAHFRQAWELVTNRHDVFKTAFVGDEGALHQLVADAVIVPWYEEDWRELTADEQAARFEQYRLADKAAGFDLEQPGLQRVSMFRIGEDRWQMLWTHHHLLLDGWSIPLVYQEVMVAYQAISNGQTVTLPAAADFESYMRWLQSRDLDEAHAWWQNVLGDFESTTPLGIDKLPAEAVTEFREASFHFSEAESQRLDAYARSQQTTLNTVMQLAWGYLLHRYSGENDVVFGTVISGRPAEVSRIEEMVGLFINAIPVKVSFGDRTDTGALLGRIHRAFQESQQFGFLPLPEVQRRSRVRAGEPLFNTVMAFENYPLDTALSSAENAPARPFEIEKSTAEEGRTNYKLVMVASFRTSLKLRCDYRSDEFSAETIARLLEHLTIILRSLPEAGHVTDIDILGEAERAQLAAWNDTAAPLPNRFVHELFEEQTARTPNAIAVVDADRTITYEALDGAANALAHDLIARGITPGSIIGLRVTRSIEEIVAVLAAWKAGAAYVPLDPSYPQDRLDYMRQDSGAVVVLTEGDIDVKQSSSRQVDKSSSSTTGRLEDSTTPGLGDPTTHPAYVIYTSGSTGQPKGVLNTHAGLANLCAWHHRTFEPSSKSVCGHLNSISFDASVYDIWPYLLAGARVAIVSDEERADSMLLSKRYERDGVTHCLFPTALLEHLAHQDVPEERWRSLEIVIAGGDKLSGYCMPKGSRARLFNHYGPTEAAVVSTSIEVTPEWVGAPPIGTPIDNATVHVLNADLQQVPVGVAGELHIGGSGLALGYLGRPELTAQRFITFDNKGENQRLYKTGDLVRLLPDGNLEFLGRVDDQVKIRGFRIELGEIVARLLQCTNVREAVVLAKGEGAAQKQLIAYVVAEDFHAETVKEELRQSLPEYMIPSSFVVMDAFPLTTNGKVDRKALPEPELVVAEAVAPRTATESELVAVWQELLRYAPAGADDHFFERGGHSLLASQAIARIRRRCNVELPLVALFENPTPASLARVIDATRGTLAAPAAIEPLRDYTSVPLSFAQQRLWFIEQFEQGTTAYNINMTLRVRGDFDVDVFLRALHVVARRQWSLRTRFVAVDGNVRQEIADTIVLPVRVIEASDAAEVAETLRFERSLPFDMATDLLWRGVIIRAGEEEHWLHFTTHHAITDGWSNGIFKAEIVDAYETLLHGGDVDAEPLPLQYADYAAWQQRTLDEERLGALMHYWKSQLEGMPKFHSLPLDFARPKELGRRGGAVQFSLDPETYAALKAYCAQSGVTMYMALIAAFSVLVARLGGKDDVVLGTPVANRPSQDLERVIGFFVNTVVLRVGVDGRSTFDQVAEQVRGITLAAQHHQELPFERLVAELQPDRDASGHPLFQLCFAFNNTPGSNRAAIQIDSVEAEEHSAMFDLTLSVNELEDRLAGAFYFNSELFKPSTIEGLSAKFCKVLTAVARDPKVRVETIEVVEKLALPSVKRVAR